MPFRYHQQPIRELKKYKDLAIRGDSAIDKLVRKAIKEIGAIGAENPNVLYIPLLYKIPDFNTKPEERCLVPHCQTLGLNILEVQSWLDNRSNFVDGVNWLESASICDFDERQMYYEINRTFPHGGSLSVTLCHRLN